MKVPVNNNSSSENLSPEELSFAVFCIENLAARLNMDPAKVYLLLTEKTDILYDYIIPCYESLHTQDREYILDDIVDVMKEKGVKRCDGKPDSASA